MTRQEMTQLFSLMRLAWPNAPMFQPERIKPTVILWTACLPDVDFLTGQAAVMRLCRECRYPPSIAEMLDAAEGVRDEIQTRVDNACYAFALKGVFRNGYTREMFKEERRQALLEELREETRQLPDPDGPRK